MNDQTPQESTHRILDTAYNEHRPVAIVAMVSGGHDSQVQAEAVYEWCLERDIQHLFHVVAMDTGVSADGWRDWISLQAAQRWPRFRLWDNPTVGFQWYADNAMEYGFGYTPAHHDEFYFRMLKERTARMTIQHFKSQRFDRVMLTWGIYRGESMRRRNKPEINRIDAAVNVNPILHWTKADIAKFRVERGLFDNPFYSTVGGSGDCQCNFGNFITLNELNKHSPKLALKLAILNRAVVERHGWGWDERPSEGLIAERHGQMVLPGIEPLCIPNICEGCSRPAPGQADAEADVLLQRWDW